MAKTSGVSRIKASQFCLWLAASAAAERPAALGYRVAPGCRARAGCDVLRSPGGRAPATTLLVSQICSTEATHPRPPVEGADVPTLPRRWCGATGSGTADVQARIDAYSLPIANTVGLGRNTRITELWEEPGSSEGMNFYLLGSSQPYQGNAFSCIRHYHSPLDAPPPPPSDHAAGIIGEGVRAQGIGVGLM